MSRRALNGRTWTPGRGWDERPAGDFDFVAPRVATGGGLFDERDARAVLDAGITHVVTVARELEADVARLLGGRAAHLANGSIDDHGRGGAADPVAWFGRSVAFSLRALEADPAARVLLHCSAGINRGPSSAYAVLRALGHAPGEAELLIEDARPFAGLIYVPEAEAAVAAWMAGRPGAGRSEPDGARKPWLRPIRRRPSS